VFLNSVFLLDAQFTYDGFDPTVPVPPNENGPADHEASAAVDGSALTAVSWDNISGDPIGLVYHTDGVDEQIRACYEEEMQNCFPDRWQPCIAKRESDGMFAVVWADAEADTQDPPFNIMMQLYDSDGQPFGGEVEVNDPGSEQDLSQQLSPAVDFEGDYIVVTWAGPKLPDCSGPNFRVFARAFFVDEGVPNPMTAPFVVDNDPDWRPTGLASANPTVAIANTADPDLLGRFLVAWNSQPDTTGGPTIRQVHGQYFDLAGSIGSEFRVHVDDSDTGPNDESVRMLAESAQHTVAAGPDGQFVATWTASTLGASTDPTVWFTLLGPGFMESQQPDCDICAEFPCYCENGCLKGDVNRDCEVCGLDIQPFVNLLFGDTTCTDIVALCEADMDSDADLDVDDVPLFVCALLGFGPDCNGGGCGGGDSGGGGEGMAIMQQGGEESQEQSAPSEWQDEVDAVMAWLDENPYEAENESMEDYINDLVAVMIEVGLLDPEE